MPTLCKPSVSVPEYVITMEETLEFAEEAHAGKPQLPLALRLIQNTGRTEAAYRPAHREDTPPSRLRGAQPHLRAESKKRCPDGHRGGPGERRRDGAGHRRDHLRVLHRVPDAVADRLADQHHGVPVRHPADTHRPAGLRGGRRGDQPRPRLLPGLPRSQRPDRLLRAVLAVLPARRRRHRLAAVRRPVRRRGRGRRGARAAAASGWRWSATPRTSSRTPRTGSPTRCGPPASTSSWTAGCPGRWSRSPRYCASSPRTTAGTSRNLDFYIIHAGGPRILDDLSKFLDVDREMFRHSWATLTEYGNIASAVVLDALRRLFEEDAADARRHRHDRRLRPRHHRRDGGGQLARGGAGGTRGRTVRRKAVPVSL